MNTVHCADPKLTTCLKFADRHTDNHTDPKESLASADWEA